MKEFALKSIESHKKKMNTYPKHRKLEVTFPPKLLSLKSSLKTSLNDTSSSQGTFQLSASITQKHAPVLSLLLLLKYR